MISISRTHAFSVNTSAGLVEKRAFWAGLRRYHAGELPADVDLRAIEALDELEGEEADEVIGNLCCDE